ncbi:MAG: acyl-CoA synthetase [Gemmatimonadales bacterium]
MASATAIATRAERHAEREAIKDAAGCHPYSELLAASERAASGLLGAARDLQEQRVAYLIPPSFEHVAVQWGIWRAGCVAVPLSLLHTRPELKRALRDAEPTALVIHPDPEHEAAEVARRSGIRVWPARELLACPPRALPEIDDARRAMILYTSGTTGEPKGVVMTHAALRAQMECLAEAWGWTDADRVLLVLPLDHVHGIVNVLSCALWSGARCDMMPRFDAGETWRRLVEGGLTLFMAVPTIYQRLIAAWEQAPPRSRREMSHACRKLRLMVSGSAALPASVFERWREISGHTLLERYGMTETGMVLSNPLDAERRAGSVGTPLPGVEVRLVNERFEDVEPGTGGEILVRGPGVFLEYWRQPEATAQAFHDGWFRTGDIAILERGRYRILGRKSVDIINTGGYKVSALEIEEVLREHPAIRECAVVGVPDDEWGERVCVAAELQDDTHLDLETLRDWAARQLAPYKIPRSLLVVGALPRNPMGKVAKPEVSALFRETS